MAILAQAAEEQAGGNAVSPAENFLLENALPEGALELTLSASQGDIREEYRTDFPLSGDAFLPNFSKSVLELLSPLGAELKKEGIDLDALSQEMEEAMEEVLPNSSPAIDAERLEAMLSALRSRYSTTPRNVDPRRPGIDVSVSDNLKLGLEVSLKKRRIGADLPVAEIGGSEEEESGEARSETEKTLPEGLAESLSFTDSVKADSTEAIPVEEEAAQLMAVSRFHPYLKGGAARVSASSVSSASPKAAKAEKTGKDGEFSAAAASGGLAASQGIAPPVAAEGREVSDSGLNGKEILQEGTSRSKGIEDAFAQSASKGDAAPAGEGGEESPSGAAQKRAPVEHRVNFEQFFEGVAARRVFSNSNSDFDSGPRAGALELGSGTPLAQDEALREGLTNVVRFVRASGEQKASLIVDPPALGRVSVELTSSATGLEASIKVSSEQVRQLIQDQLAQLRWSLAQQGVQLTHFSVDVQQEDGGRQQQGTGQERRRARGISGVDAADAQDEEAGFRVDLDQGLLYWVA
jgi:flagellar hook-length control protein FliK